MYKKGLIIALVACLLDQASKYVLLYSMGFISNQIIPLTPFFNLVTVWNYGISFGILNNGNKSNAAMLIIMTLAIISFLFYWLRKTKSKQEVVALGLVIGGALGNLIDRIVYGAVFDFLDFFINNLHWPAFNVADSVICIGVFLLVIDSFSAKKNL